MFQIIKHITISLLLASLCLNTYSQTIVNNPPKKYAFIKTSGNIGLGYDYGFIPFAQNISSPAGYFKTDGNLSVTIKNIPFNATFFYTNLKNINGLNNYFRISFDAQTYRQILNSRITERKAQYLEKIPDLNQQIKLANQKIGYINHLENNIDYYFNLPDSLPTIQRPELDTINLSENLPTIDSSIYQEKFENYKDSISRIKNEWILKSDSLKNLVKQYQSIADGFDNPLKYPEIDSLMYRNKFERWMGNVKKIDIGMCYPSYSTFLVNNIPIKGLNFEYESKNYYYAFTAGTTINNLLFTNNVIQNNLQNTQNLFNFFDFNSLQQGRRIISAKAGWGKKETDHLYIGVLYGTGQQSYYTDSIQMSINGRSIKEHNMVFEIDGKINPKKWLELSAVYGKSSIRPLNDESDTSNASLNQLFSSFRSNAVLGKAIFHINKIKTNISVSLRWVDPFFRSFGVGFMRSDNLRYEIKTDHQLSKKLKAGFFYRKDENNLLNLFNYTTILHSGGANLQYRISKNISIRGNFNPVFQYSYDAVNDSEYRNQNYIGNLSVSHNKRIKKLTMVTNLVGSYYKLFNGTTNTDFTNVCLSNSINIKKISHNISASIFNSNGLDSLSGNTFLLYEDLSINFKKLTLTGGIKLSKHVTLGEQFGYNLKVNARLNKNISFELRGEKLVLGDFYNSIGIDLYRTYPYIWSSRLIINW